MQNNKMQDNEMQDNKMQDNTIQDNTMQGNPNGKWKMIRKNPDSFETVWKMGNDLERS